MEMKCVQSICGREHYPASRGHSHQGAPFPWEGVDVLQQSLGRWYGHPRDETVVHHQPHTQKTATNCVF